MSYSEKDVADEAASLLALARKTHETHVAEGKARAEEIVREAQAEADKILGDAHAELKWLEEKLVELRGFESEYRASLRDYLTGLLSNFQEVDQFVPDRTQAVEPSVTPELAVEPAWAPEPEPFFEPVAVEPAPVFNEPVAAEPESFEFTNPVDETPEVDFVPEEIFDNPVVEEPVEYAPVAEEQFTAAAQAYESPVVSDYEYAAAPVVEPVSDVTGWTTESSDDLPAFDGGAELEESATEFDGFSDNTSFDAQESYEESAFDSSISGESFDDVLAGVETLEENDTPSFDLQNEDSTEESPVFTEPVEEAPAEFGNFVPGEGTDDPDEVGKKLKGFFGLKRN